MEATSLSTNTVIAVAVAAAVIVITFVLLTRAFRPTKAVAKKASARSQITIMGASNTGKTVLMHRLAYGSTPKTVASIHESKASWTVNNKSLELIDVPGHPQMKGICLREADKSAAVIVTVDASSDSAAQIKQTADLLYDLFTSRTFVDAETAVLLLITKTDVPAAKSSEQVLSLLEQELERLKSSRPSIATAGDDANADTLLLGSVNQAFSFKDDCPVPFDVQSIGAESDLSGIVDFVGGL